MSGELQRALACARAGDMRGALAEAERGLIAAPLDAPLLALAALAALRLEDRVRAIGLLGRQLAVNPGDRAARVNLATALVQEGRNAEALTVARVSHDHPRLARLAGFLLQDAGEHASAAAAYATVVAAEPADFESWNNLANCHTELGDYAAAAAAFTRAINAAPLPPPEVFINLCELLARLDNREGRVKAAERAALLHPEHPGVQLQLGLAQAASGQTETALETLARLAEAEAQVGAATIEYGLLLENINRLDQLEALVAALEHRPAAAETAFLKAWALRRRDRFAEAAALAARIPATINPIRAAQLRGEIADRLGETAEAWEQFVLMNRAALAATAPLSAPTYRQQIEAQTLAMAAPPPAAGTAWAGPDQDPVFIVGFPRSGTTLLDTLLSALPELEVFEEQPFLTTVDEQFAGLARSDDADRIAAARLRYFALAEAVQPIGDGRRIVDKHPLHLTHMPLIHRMFPRAAIVLVERHPCDAVLSCVMANFVLNPAMRSFTELEEAARTYDAVMTNWSRARALLPLAVHQIRYEAMVGNLEAAMRPLVAFLGLPWRDSVLDNQASARQRGLVRTASYAQVGQQLYRRAVGRWERYRSVIKPVLPILRPWIERMSYDS